MSNSEETSETEAKGAAKKDYYEILGVARTCSHAEIKKAYRTLALRLHPDHNKSPLATEQFQELAKIHSVLSDAKKRAFYDKHGDLEEDTTESEMDAYEYWRSVFPAFTEKDIEDFRKTYVDSCAEAMDLMTNYAHYKGDMRCVMECVPFADSENFDRLVAIMEREIPKKSPFRKKWVQSCKGLKKKIQKEEASERGEAEEMKKQLGLGKDFDKPAGDDGIPEGVAALIRQKQSQRESYLDTLAAKYAQPAKLTGKRKKNSS